MNRRNVIAVAACVRVAVAGTKLAMHWPEAKGKLRQSMVHWCFERGAGYLGHEFIPTREPMAGLREAVGICAVT